MESEVAGSANCLPPGVQVGEYRLMNVVGEGGFGIVYKARDLSLDRIVAIKEYMPSTLAGRMSSHQIHVRSQHRGAFDAGLRSFINEARLLAKFSHPALVHVYRFFEDNNTAYMVMRYYEGQTFRGFLDTQQSAINQRWLTAMLSPVLDVLEMLHAADCYHRDIAPDNLFLQASGMPVLLDFGAARRIIGDMTQALTMVLKPGFAPIEQYVDDGAMSQGAWTDIYQIGAMLYLAITGKTPATSVARMISDPLQQLTPEQYPGYTAEFLHGVHRALMVKPQDRPQSIAELKQLLGIGSVSSAVHTPWSASASVPLDLDITGTSQASPVPPVSTHSEIAVPVFAPVTQPPASSGPAFEPSASTPWSSLLADAAPTTPASPSLPGWAVQNENGNNSTHKVRDELNLFASGNQPVTPEHSAPGEPGRSSASNASPPQAGDFQETQQFDLNDLRPLPPPAAGQPWGVSSNNAARPNSITEPSPPSSPPPVAPVIAAKPPRRVLPWAWILGSLVCLGVLAWWWFSSGKQPEAPTSTVETQAVSEESQQWLQASQTGTTKALRAYLGAYPDGEYREQALALLKQLEAEEARVTAPPPTAQASAASPLPPASSTPTGMSSTPVPAPPLAQASTPANAPLSSNAKPPASTTPVNPPLATAQPASSATQPGKAAARTTDSTPPSPSGGTTPSPTAPPVAGGKTAGKSSESGQVILRVMPWGNVSVNHSPVGTTPPLTQLDLPVGQHRIEISNPAGPPVVKIVQVKKGEPVVLSHQFE